MKTLDIQKEFDIANKNAIDVLKERIVNWELEEMDEHYYSDELILITDSEIENMRAEGSAITYLENFTRESALEELCYQQWYTDAIIHLAGRMGQEELRINY